MFDEDYDEELDDVKFEKFTKKNGKPEDFRKDKAVKKKHRKPTDKDRFLREDEDERS